LAWTEKIWASIARTDGTLQLDFGLGKYQNRGIIDGFGGVSRGREQWTVRASRELHSAPEATAVGPVRMEVVEPLRQMRFVLEPNDVQPISFDVVLSGVTPPYFEERNLVRNRRTGRVDVDVIRYHQGGWATGTVTVDGQTHDVNHEEWFGFRDHSWGVRQAIGAPAGDLIPTPAAPSGVRGGMKWSPAFFQRPDGTYYETAIFIVEGPWEYSSAYLNDADGNQTPVRVTEVEALGDSGFFLKTAGYGDWAGHKHGSWTGALHVDGEYLADCWSDENLAALGQFRDTPIRVRDGDAVGYGIMESLIGVVWPELGLTAESDHKVSYT
jgi:hypothetical protein